jgi:glycosyltransferase involved in cell wall biosynthesis
VLAVINGLEVGGAQQHLLTLTRGLAGSGYRFVVATSGNEPLDAVFRREGVPVITLSRRSIKHRVSPVFMARLALLASSGNFHLIHGHLHSASIAAAVAARISGLPLVLTHHSMNTWRPPYHVALGRWADRQADAVIAVSSNIAAAVEQGGVSVRIIPNWVRPPTQLWTETEIAAARNDLDIPCDAYVISYIGRFSRDKNPLLFVEAAAIIAERSSNAHFLLVGDGPLRSEAEARGRALGIENRLNFIGFRSNAADLHQVVDVLALSSNSEGSPLVVLEAMAVGRPVVATAVGDVPEQIVHGETGLIVPPQDAQALANAVLALENTSLRWRMGRAARERVLHHFSVERGLSLTMAVYREALHQHEHVGVPSRS